MKFPSFIKFCSLWMNSALHRCLISACKPGILIIGQFLSLMCSFWSNILKKIRIVLIKIVTVLLSLQFCESPKIGCFRNHLMLLNKVTVSNFYNMNNSKPELNLTSNWINQRTKTINTQNQTVEMQNVN